MNDLDEGFCAVARSLVDFGYTETTAKDVEVAHEKWIRGEPSSGIIEMMSVGQFEDYPQIFGNPTGE